MTNMRILAGARLLDQHRPGWFDAINLDILDQYDALKCVLGQLYDGYYAGRKTLGLSQDEAVDHGFDSRTHSDSINATEEWQALISNRQAAYRAGTEYLDRDLETPQTPQLYTLEVVGLDLVDLTWDDVSALVSSMPDVELTITRPGK